MSHPAHNGQMLKFPDGFLWGTATAPTQIEGHIYNEWTDFVALDGRTCHPACDSYHRYEEDIEWMRKLGVNSYRVGIEWSRLQSAAYAPLDEKEMARYVDQLDRLRAAGIEPMVVLHHFSNPSWIYSSGGWLADSTIAAFVDYAGKLARALRDKVRIWNTFNEPDTYASCGYLIGHFPPRRKGRLLAYRRIIRNMGRAHHRVCGMLREIGSSFGAVEVGFSKNWTFYEAYQSHLPWDVLLAAFTHSHLNTLVMENFLGGEKTTSTFLGINYYGRIRFRNFEPLVPAYGFTCDHLAKLGVHCDDMLERHPDGLELALKSLQAQCDLPIYLTEHGSASTDEVFRERDLKENLSALHRAISGGVDVRGFYYWSLLDNFEWQFGYTKKFGLVAVDFDHEALPRKMKPLGEIYAKVCRENALSSGSHIPDPS
ncbi:MAG: hypothetical protein C5B50_18460 [Verrucomicrobia bacterium]|nr:MAG: hypothetical protein C5B50_18460 [Verrucomicrobiota bacterium]